MHYVELQCVWDCFTLSYRPSDKNIPRVFQDPSHSELTSGELHKGSIFDRSAHTCFQQKCNFCGVRIKSMNSRQNMFQLVTLKSVCCTIKMDKWVTQCQGNVQISSSEPSNMAVGRYSGRWLTPNLIFN